MATRTQKKAMKERKDAEAKAKTEAKRAAAKDAAAKKAAGKGAKPSPKARAGKQDAKPDPTAASNGPVSPASPTSAKRKKATKGQAIAAAKEPVLIEFQDQAVASVKHVQSADEARDEAAEHADNVAAELMRRRSKPIVIDADDAPAPSLPVGGTHRSEEVLQLDPAPPAKRSDPPAPHGLSIPEHFLLLALEPGWDERREKAGPGGLGGALVGSLLLELALQGKLQVQRDRFTLTDKAVDDGAQAVAQHLQQLQGQPSLQAMARLVKPLRTLLPTYKDRLAGRGLVAHESWRHLGMFHRSQTALLDGDAQERLRNKLARAIAGGGRPDAPTILSLGLLEASGLFGLVVPEGAQAYNRKRLNGLLAGKDVMGYKVDDELRGMQEIAVRTILDNVRTMTAR